jgi:uncharacterized protein (TIGR02147 family)
MIMQVYLNYRSWLKLELENRKESNSQYSLRAFARDLGIASSTLSEVIARKKALSIEKGKQVAAKLCKDEDSENYFSNLVAAEESKCPSVKSNAQMAIQKMLSGHKKYESIRQDIFKSISDWQHFAILEMVHLPQFGHSIEDIVNRIGITEEKAKDAVDRLVRLGLLLIDENGRWLSSDNKIFGSENTVEALQEYHRQVIGKARDSISNTHPKDRELNTLMLAVRKEDIPRLKKRINHFVDAFDLEASELAKGEQDSLYALSVQFFPLEK